MNTNNEKPFEHVYKEIQSKFYDSYNSIKDNKNYATGSLNSPTDAKENGLSIDNILNNESDALLDKTRVAAKAILSRLSINDYISYNLDYSSLKIRNDLLEFQRLLPYGQTPFDRSKSTMLSELNSIEKQRLDEKVKCWQDILMPVNYFMELYHKNKALKQDKNMLEKK